MDAILLAQLFLGIGVDLCDCDLVLGELEGCGELFVDGSKSLAVATPRSKEFDEGRLARVGDEGVEVVGLEVDDGRR